MGKIVGKAQYRDTLLGAGLLWATLALVMWPEQAMGAMRDGIGLCGNVILPSLFPFFVLSSLVVELGMSRYLGRLLSSWGWWERECSAAEDLACSSIWPTCWPRWR